jgi:hypothetical protein
MKDILVLSKRVGDKEVRLFSAHVRSENVWVAEYGYYCFLACDVM